MLSLLVVLGGCASADKSSRQQQVASILAYLYPDAGNLPMPSDRIAELSVPFRIGVAFVPDNSNPQFRLPEKERILLSTQVRDAFSPYPFVREIVVIPSTYLASGGGFKNLDQVADLFKLDVIALVSFDQVQNAGATSWSFLYWTGLGAYIIDGDQYDILTTVETSVFDIRSRQLLLRAGGLSNNKGTATMVGFSEEARKARSQ
ncbi:MAG: rhombotarget lipoprotein, partial [Quisquiliibacterium sp.]